MDALLHALQFLEQHAKVGTFVVGLFAVLVAVFAIRANRRTAREVAAINFINDLSSDKHLARGVTLLQRASHECIELQYLAKEWPSVIKKRIKSPRDEAIHEDFLAILRLLNYYENMAIGARIGILDIRTLRMSRRHQIVRAWELLEGFIEALRTSGDDRNPCLYEHFEWLKNCMSCESRLSRCRPCKCNWLKCTSWFRRFTRRCPCKDD